MGALPFVMSRTFCEVIAMSTSTPSERMIQTRVSLPEQVNRAVRAYGARRGITKADAIAAIVAAHVGIE